MQKTCGKGAGRMKSAAFYLKRPISVFSRFSLSDFALSLFIFNILFDPGNALFHTKILTFAFALTMNMRRMTFSMKTLAYILIFYIAFTVSVSLMILRGIAYDPSFINMYSTTFLTLILFFLRPNKIHIQSAVTFSCIVIAIISLVITFLLTKVPAALVFIQENNAVKAIFMIARHKKVLFWWLPSVFHRSSSIIILVYAQKLYDFLRAKKRTLCDFLLVNLFFWSLFFTGTRANMFSIILITGIVYLDFVFYCKKQVLKFQIFLSLGILFAAVGIFALLTVKNSSSVAKDGHILSYHELFSEHPSYILIGEGPGSYFFTKAYNTFLTNTELSYYELLRMFGIFFTSAILCCYLSPLLHIRKLEGNRNIVTVMAYTAYLFIAGTNPLLIGPTGFMAWWITENYLYKENWRILCRSQ